MVQDQKEIWVIKVGLVDYPPISKQLMFCVWEETKDNWKTYETKRSYRSLPPDWESKGDLMWWMQHWFG